jgi:5-oxoprolinase (ATP-hydrolysing)
VPETHVETTVFVRAPGQEHALPIDVPEPRPSSLAPWVIDRFRNAYAHVFAHAPTLGGAAAGAVEVESLRVRAYQEPVSALAGTSWPGPDVGIGEAPSGVRAERGSLTSPVTGPALIHEPHSVTVVEPGWTAEALACGALRLRRVESHAVSEAEAGELPLDVLGARLGAIATEMGELLRRTAKSVNIRERVDFSCAVLDAAGELIVNAPHVPVHLGALGVCVREVAAVLPLGPGEVAITNHPAFGGSHLPDVTLIAGVHVEGRLCGYVAARAHHAEIGGIAPGSMSADARSLAEEACVLAPMKLVDGRGHAFETLERRFRAGPWPSRAPEDNLADVRAALAACVRGREALHHLARRVSAPVLERQFEALKARAAERLRLALARRGPFEAALRERLDAGPAFSLRLHSDGESIAFDFSGSDPAHASTLNATPAIVRSVVIYALRLLLGEDAALNEGLMRRAQVVLPRCFLNPAFDADPACCPAVGAGNVETSQRLTNAILRALGLAAESQGTMNNVLIGGPGWATYETLGGGAGAGPGFDGASCVHTHMTNTRLTDPEMIENRFPLRVVRFERRRGSGGAGTRRGGEGLVREYLFNAPACVTLLAQRRERGPEGLDGGAAGWVGRQTMIGVDGRAHALPSRVTCWFSAGERLVVETPGGGGWGRASG